MINSSYPSSSKSKNFASVIIPISLAPIKFLSVEFTKFAFPSFRNKKPEPGIPYFDGINLSPIKKSLFPSLSTSETAIAPVLTFNPSKLNLEIV